MTVTRDEVLEFLSGMTRTEIFQLMTPVVARVSAAGAEEAGMEYLEDVKHEVDELEVFHRLEGYMEGELHSLKTFEEVVYLPCGDVVEITTHVFRDGSVVTDTFKRPGLVEIDGITFTDDEIPF